MDRSRAGVGCRRPATRCGHPEWPAAPRAPYRIARGAPCGGKRRGGAGSRWASARREHRQGGQPLRPRRGWGWDHVDFVVDALLSEKNSGSPVLALSCPRPARWSACTTRATTHGSHVVAGSTSSRVHAKRRIPALPGRPQPERRAPAPGARRRPARPHLPFRGLTVLVERDDNLRYHIMDVASPWMTGGWRSGGSPAPDRFGSSRVCSCGEGLWRASRPISWADATCSAVRPMPAVAHPARAQYRRLWPGSRSAGWRDPQDAGKAIAPERGLTGGLLGHDRRLAEPRNPSPASQTTTRVPRPQPERRDRAVRSDGAAGSTILAFLPAGFCKSPAMVVAYSGGTLDYRWPVGRLGRAAGPACGTSAPPATRPRGRLCRSGPRLRRAGFR